MTVYNHYEFKHIDDSTTYLVSFNADLGSSVIDSFVQFMCGCGFAKDFVIEYMEEIVDEHKDMKKKLAEIKDDLINLD
jgi:hypothetical protein